MTAYKKLFLGIIFASAIATFSLVAPKHASAATLADAQQCQNTLKFTDIAHIECATSQGVVTFVDQNPSDEDADLLVVPPGGAFHKVNYKPTNFSVFCDAGTIPAPALTPRPFAYDQGITRNGGEKLTLADATKPSISVTLNIGYTAAGTTACSRYGGSDGQGANVTGTDKIRYLFQFQGNNITSLAGVNSDGDLGGKSYGLISGYNPGTAGLDISVFSSGAWRSCSGDLVIMQTSGAKDSAIATVYTLGSGTEPTTTKFPDVYSLFVAGGVTDCKVSPNVLGGAVNAGQSFGILGIPPTPAPPGSKNPGDGGSDTADAPTCESSDSTNLGWIFCPVLRSIDKAVQMFYNEVEDQLCVKAGVSSTAGGTTCKDKDLLTTPTGDKKGTVKDAWSNMRIIATSLLVIAMLVAIISQALGGSFLDAYTLRKLLPKLVAAVILIQLSWYLGKFAIDLSNDLGVGIRDLMYAPFGGNSVKDIDNALGFIDTSGVLITGAALFAGGIAIAFSGLSLVGVALLGVPVVLAVLVGYLVLVFRQILILLSMILVPLALVAWLLPGTERYWKLWRETFVKLLMMFPMIMALIAAGHIFGTIGGKTGGIAGLIMVLVGFFGPLAVLPKTFNWGGAALGALGGAVINGTKGLRQKPAKYSLEQAKLNKEQRSLARANRLATTEPGNRRLFDRALAGEFNFARNRATRERQFERTLAQGDKEAREEVAAQLLRVGFENMRHGPAVDAQGNRIQPGQAGYETNKLDALQAWLEGREYAGVAPDEALMGHAFDELAKLGDPDRIRAARRNSHGHEAMWTKAMARNFGRMNEIARDFTLAPDLTNLSPRQYSTQDADTAQELLRQVQQGYIMDRETGQQRGLTPPEQQEQRQRAVAFADEVANNDLIYGDLGTDHRRVIDELRTMRDPAQVGVVRGARRGGVTIPPRATLPEGPVLAAQPQAENNLVQALTDPARRAVVATEFAHQLDDPVHGPAYQNFLQSRVQAHTGTSQAAAELNTRLATAYRTHLDERVAAYEQTLLTQGMQPAAIQTAVAAAQQQANQDYQARFP